MAVYFQVYSWLYSKTDYITEADKDGDREIKSMASHCFKRGFSRTLYPDYLQRR